jgi:hypothetical protein
MLRGIDDVGDNEQAIHGWNYVVVVVVEVVEVKGDPTFRSRAFITFEQRR